VKSVAIGLTSGDPNGIGPEVSLRAASRPQPANRRLVLIGHRAVWQRTANLTGLPLPVEVADLHAPLPPVATWSPAELRAPRIRPGAICAQAAKAAYAAILAAADAAQDRRLQAIVTAPISKEAFHRAGLRIPGHTELLAKRANRRVAMMLFGKRIRVVLATRHLPLRNVPRALSIDAIVEAIQMLAKALPWMGFPQARIGVCGLNPHAGDGGALGTEEQTLIAPAIARCRRMGCHVQGPVPADVIFYQHLAGVYDAVVAMYHDQGLAPMKMLSFDSGVNLTLGLPYVRTSPDHGTAFDIAGKNRANPASTISALDWAARLAGRPNPWA